MALALPKIQSLRGLTRDGRLLFATRIVRMAAYGALAVVLALYLAAIGMSEAQIGLLLSLTLLGDVAVSIAITSVADRIGRRRMLTLGAGLMILAGLVFALTRDPIVLTLAAIVGTISPSGAEVGPFLAIEQATLPQTIADRQRTQMFAWYNLAGSLATAFGALIAGLLIAGLQSNGVPPVERYRVVLVGYALLGGVLALLFRKLSPAAEAASPTPHAGATNPWFGLHRSRGVVLKLAALFALDAFAGGLVVQSLLAYWFVVRFGVGPGILGLIFFGGNLLAGISALVAARVAARFGLINTMVWSHIPSNVLLMLVPLMPVLPLAILVLLARFSISQMDVPTRQSYTMAVVDADERSAAAGVTTIVRTLASALSPALTGLLLGGGWLGAPFFLAGAIKIVYDLALYRSFQALKPPEEQEQSSAARP
jgi:MFS family permease